MIDGRDSFGVSWGSSSNNDGDYNSSSGSAEAWNGKVSLFDASNHDVLFSQS